MIYGGRGCPWKLFTRLKKKVKPSIGSIPESRTALPCLGPSQASGFCLLGEGHRQ